MVAVLSFSDMTFASDTVSQITLMQRLYHWIQTLFRRGIDNFTVGYEIY